CARSDSGSWNGWYLDLW
nr:immunoglobulin heavy chain junction region [Macaca mulatta]MOX61274.1 immunoglobulin heavy chain junction region [Macaca mulatta]MOX61579.1 immunoglobulin heavy chain junction region [Macaca mulatta]MOX62784.1 immunoglobulin heavy chain junction region [Macaca mulatta]MOX64753.1 immunoglobulin heavy chain junction region [Macaca mulatta]